MSEQTTTTTTGWAVLGPGSIARTFLKDLHASSGAIVSVGSSDPARSDVFAEEAERAGYPDVTAGTYEEALADPRVDAVYVATVHTGHARLVLAALEAGKAVLCEKPLAVNHGTAMVLVDAARQAGVPLVEAFVYRFHPQTAALLDLIRERRDRGGAAHRRLLRVPEGGAGGAPVRPGDRRAAASSTSAATR